MSEDKQPVLVVFVEGVDPPEYGVPCRVRLEQVTDYAARCLEAGKHVLLAKPIARSLADIARLKKAASRGDRLCMPSHNYIYAPDLREAKRRLDAGDFGRLSSFWMIYNQRHPAEIAFADLITREVMVHHA